MLATLTGLPVLNSTEHLRDRVEDTLAELKETKGDPAALLCSSSLATSTCDWSFAGGPRLFLQLLGLGVACCHPRRTRRPTLSEVLQTLQGALLELKACVKECVICMDARRTTVLHPCRHSVACASCAQALAHNHFPCPICRLPITSVETVQGPVMHTFARRNN